MVEGVKSAFSTHPTTESRILALQEKAIVKPTK